MDNWYNFYNFEAPFREYLLAVNPHSRFKLFTKPLHKVSVKNYLSDIRYFFGWYILYLKLAPPIDALTAVKDLSHEAVSAYRSYMKENAIPARTINRRLSSLRKFCTFCQSQGWLTENPAKLIGNLIELNKPINKAKLTIVKKGAALAPFFSKLHSLEEERNKVYRLLSTYKKYSMAGLIILSCLLLVLIVRSFKKASLPAALLKVPTESTRSLSFQGTLTDKNGNLINSPTNGQFRIYKDIRSEDYIYSSGICTIRPNETGQFIIVLGKDCGPKINSSAFTNNQHLYLGITLGSDPEMKPRQELTNTGYAENARTLQGLPIGSKPSSIPFIDQTGALLITTTSPSIRSDSGNFSIQGNTLTLQTTPESGGNINLSPASGGNVLITSGDFSVGEGFKVSTTGGLIKMNQINYFWPSVQGIEGSILSNDGLGNLSWLPNNSGGWKDEGTVVKLTSALDNVIIGATASNSAKLTVSGTGNQREVLIKASENQLVPIFEIQNSSGTTLTSIGATGSINTNVDMVINANNLSSGSRSFNLFNTEVTNLNIGGATTSLVLGSLSGLTTVRNSLTINGSLGIGTTSPGAKFEVTGGQTKIEISTQSSNQFSKRLCHSGTDIDAAQHVILGDCANGGADLAEYYGSSDRNIEAGDVVVASGGSNITGSSSKAYVEKSTRASQGTIIGIVSTNPYDSFGKNFDPAEYSVPVALAGRVPVKVSTENGAIAVGDFLTSSSTPGVAMKAKNAGVVIGKALEGYKGEGEGISIKKILVFVNLSWADPHLYFSENGALQIPPEDENIYSGLVTRLPDTLIESLAERISTRLVEAQRIIANTITTDVLNAKKITSSHVETATLVATESAKIAVVQTSVIEPQNQDITIDLSHQQEKSSNNPQKGQFAKLIIKGFADKPVASIDAAGNASFSGTLTASHVQTDRVTTKEIVSDTTNSLKERLSQLANQTTEEQNSFSRQLVNSSTSINNIQKMLGELKNQPIASVEAQPFLASNENINLASLTVAGQANLYQAFINTSLAVGDLLIENGSISTLSQELKLSAPATINFFHGKVLMAADGSIITEGKIIAKGGIEIQNSKFKVQSAEGLETASIEASGAAQFSNLAINSLAIKNKYLGATESAALIQDIAGPAIQADGETAGNGFIPANADAIIIYNSNIKENSLIYLTPTGPIGAGQLTVIQKDACVNQNPACKPYFKVSNGSPTTAKTQFNWLIIN